MRYLRGCFDIIHKNILKFMRKSKRTSLSKTILKMINKTEGMTLPGFKTYITEIIKTIVLTEGDT